MNRWRVFFIFLAGFWLHETLAHIWLNVEGLLPINSILWPWPITAEINMVFIFLNLLIFSVLAYFAFFYSWATEAGGNVLAEPRGSHL